MSGAAPLPLIGRGEDLEVLCSFVDRAAKGGGSGSLLLSGDPGVGKTVLLELVASSATDSGIRVLRATGAEFEANVSFAGLNQLLHPLFGEIGQLRPAYARALRVSLGLDDGAQSDQLMASNAAVELLVQAATRQPILIVVDDLPWIDRASSSVFGFIARRTQGTRVGFLAALRTGSESFLERRGLVEYELLPLDETSSGQLLDARFPALGARTRSRLLAEAQGNPLALLELPATLIVQGAVRTPPQVLPLSRRLQSVFAGRITCLPTATRHLLLLAALDGTGDLNVLDSTDSDRAVLADLGAAEHSQLITLENQMGRLAFRHPLIRAAVVDLSTLDERRRAHEELAARRIDLPARRAWHLAEAAVGPDEGIATLLHGVAHTNLMRGDSVGAITELLRAAELSPAGAQKGVRLAEAAYLGESVTGDLRSVPKLLEEARRVDPATGGSLSGAVAGAYHLLNGHGDVEAAHRLLSGAIDALPDEAFDIRNQQQLAPTGNAPLTIGEGLYTLAMVCFFGGRADLWEPFRSSLSRLRPKPPEVLALLAETFSDPVRRAPKVLARLDAAITGFPHDTSPARIVRIGTAASYLDRLPRCRGALWRAVEHGREGGAITSSIEALFLLSNAAFWTGEWDELAALTEEGLDLCDAHGYRLLSWPGLFLKALLAAARGDDSTCKELAHEMTSWAAPRGARAILAYAHHARTLAALGQDDYQLAYEQAVEVSPPGTFTSHLPHALWMVLDLVEAAMRSGHHAEAKAHAVAAYEANIGSLSPRLELVMHGAAAMAAADGDDAVLFDKALTVSEAERWPFDLARIQLAHGERLRRRKDKAEARKHLSAARDVFQRLGAQPWTVRAGNELRATGVTIGQAEAVGAGSLTPQQLEIARLAAAGLTNKEIGERLFLSHRTIGTHLYQLFPKLGISSRAALGEALKGLVDEP